MEYQSNKCINPKPSLCKQKINTQYHYFCTEFPMNLYDGRVMELKARTVVNPHQSGDALASNHSL